MTLAIVGEPVPLLVDSNGAVRVGNTRVTLETVIGAYLAGSSPEEISAQFSALDLADIYAVIAYYLRHQAEIDAYLQQVEIESRQIRQQLETQFNHGDVKTRLLARRNNQS